MGAHSFKGERYRIEGRGVVRSQGQRMSCPLGSELTLDALGQCSQPVGDQSGVAQASEAMERGSRTGVVSDFFAKVNCTLQDSACRRQIPTRHLCPRSGLLNVQGEEARRWEKSVQRG
jgi:hypothetical protein